MPVNEQLHCKGTRTPGHHRTSPRALSVLIWGYSVVLLGCFKGIDAKPKRVFFKSGIFPYFTALEVPVESLSKPMN